MKRRSLTNPRGEIDALRKVVQRLQRECDEQDARIDGLISELTELADVRVINKELRDMVDRADARGDGYRAMLKKLLELDAT